MLRVCGVRDVVTFVLVANAIFNGCVLRHRIGRKKGVTNEEKFECCWCDGLCFDVIWSGESGPTWVRNDLDRRTRSPVETKIRPA
jgi:hypothetical protein